MICTNTICNLQFRQIPLTIWTNPIGNLDKHPKNNTQITITQKITTNPDHLICDKDKVEEARPVSEVSGQRQEALAHPSEFFVCFAI